MEGLREKLVDSVADYFADIAKERFSDPYVVVQSVETTRQRVYAALDKMVTDMEVSSEEAFKTFWSLKEGIVKMYTAQTQAEETRKIWAFSSMECLLLFGALGALSRSIDAELYSAVQESRSVLEGVIKRRDSIVDSLMLSAYDLGADNATRYSMIQDAVRSEFHSSDEFLEFSSGMYRAFQAMGNALNRSGVMGSKVDSVAVDAMLEAGSVVYWEHVVLPTAREIYGSSVESLDA